MDYRNNAKNGLLGYCILTPIPATVILGRPARICRNYGICKILPHRFYAKIDIPHKAMATVFTENNRLVIIFKGVSLVLGIRAKHFKQNNFKMQECFVISRWLIHASPQRWLVRRGDYRVQEVDGGENLMIKLPLYSWCKEEGINGRILERYGIQMIYES